MKKNTAAAQQIQRLWHEEEGRRPHRHDVVITSLSVSHQQELPDSVRPLFCNHEGNKNFRYWVREARKTHHLTQDDSTGEQAAAKQAAAREAFQKVKSQSPPGRFLILNNAVTGWVEISDVEAVMEFIRREVHKIPVLERKKCEELHKVVERYMPPCIWCRIGYVHGHLVTMSLMRHVLEVEVLPNFDFADITSKTPQTYVTQLFNMKYNSYDKDVINRIKALGFPPLPTGPPRAVMWVPPLVPFDAGTIAMPDENPPRFVPDLIIQNYYPRSSFVQTESIQINGVTIQVPQPVHAGPHAEARAPPAREIPERSTSNQGAMAQIVSPPSTRGPPSATACAPVQNTAHFRPHRPEEGVDLPDISEEDGNKLLELLCNDVPAVSAAAFEPQSEQQTVVGVSSLGAQKKNQDQSDVGDASSAMSLADGLAGVCKEARDVAATGVVAPAPVGFAVGGEADNPKIRGDLQTVVGGGFRNKRRADAANSDTSITGGGASTMSRVAEGESPATRPNNIDDLTFTILFDALKISLQDPGPHSVMQHHTDDSYGVEAFLAFFRQNPERVLRHHGFTKSVHQRRLRGFIVWFETKYKNSKTNPSRAVLNRQSWLPFFTDWVRNGCPSVSQQQQQQRPRPMQPHQQRPPMPQHPQQHHVSLPLQQPQVPSISSGERGTVASITEDMSMMSVSTSLAPSELSPLTGNQPWSHSGTGIMEDSTL